MGDGNADALRIWSDAWSGMNELAARQGILGAASVLFAVIEVAFEAWHRH